MRYWIVLIIVTLLVLSPSAQVNDPSESEMKTGTGVESKVSTILLNTETSLSSNSIRDNQSTHAIEDEEITTYAVTLSSPEDVELSLNGPTYTIIWEVDGTGNLGNSKYDIMVNGTVQEPGSVPWKTGDQITYDFVPNTVGTFNVTIEATSNAGTAVDTVFVYVVNKLRFISEPTNQTFSLESDSSFLDWTISDDDPDIYKIYKNSTLQISSSWTSGTTISYNMAGNGLGIYNITFVATDQSGNSINNTVFIRITAGPVLVDITDTTIFDNETESYVFFWTFQDNNPDQYEIYNDSGLISSGTWESNQQLNTTISTQNLGIFNYSLHVNDIDGQSVWSNVSITITDRPEIVQHEVISDETGLIVLEWIAEDLYNSTYSIRINNSNTLTGNWNSGEVVQFNMTNFPSAYYIVTITFFDEQGLFRSNTTEVTIQDITNPVIEPVEDQEISYTEGSIMLNFTASDNNPSTYQIIVDNLVISEGNWENQVQYLYTFDDNDLGEHDITAVFIDSSGNASNTSLIVNVVDDQAPVLLSATDSGEYPVNAEIELSWTFIDINPGAYQITSNRTNGILRGGNWASNVTIDFAAISSNTVNVEYTISIWDAALNQINNSITLQIIPVITQEPAITTYDQTYASDPLTYVGNWTDIRGKGVPAATISTMVSNDSYSSDQLDELTNQEGQYSLTLDHKGLSAGTYLWNITFSKFQHQNWTILLQVDVEWHNIEFDIKIPTEITQGDAFTIDILVQYDDQFRGISTFDFVNRNGPAEGIGLVFNFTMQYFGKPSQTISEARVTDVNGEISILVAGELTKDLRRITGYNLQFNEDLQIIINTSIDELNINPRIRGSNLINSFKLTFGFHPFLIVLIGSIIFFKPLKNGIQGFYINVLSLYGKWKYLYLYELSTVQTLLLFNNNGILYYSKQFDPKRSTDPSLIAGLSSAVTAFMSELDNRGRSGFHLMDREDLSILIHTMSKSSIALLSNSEVGPEVRDMVKNAHKKISKEYKKEFETGIGDFNEEDDDTIEQILENNGFPIHLMTNVIFDIKQIMNTIQQSDFPRFYRSQVQKVLDQVSIEKDGQTMNYHRLVDIFSSGDLPETIVAKMVLELYEKNGIY